MKKILFFSLFIIASFLNVEATGQTREDKWIFLSETSKNEKVYTLNHIEDKTTLGSETLIDIWVKSVGATQVLKGKTYINTTDRSLYSININSKKVALKTFSVYNSKGQLIKTVTYDDYEIEWDYIVPESIGEAIYNRAVYLYVMDKE